MGIIYWRWIIKNLIEKENMKETMIMELVKEMVKKDSELVKMSLLFETQLIKYFNQK